MLTELDFYELCGKTDQEKLQLLYQKENEILQAFLVDRGGIVRVLPENMPKKWRNHLDDIREIIKKLEDYN